MLACDLALAAATAQFADTHLAMGVIPGWGLSQRLSRAIGLARAKEMSLTGAFIDAPTALAWGLVSRILEPAALLPAALAAARAMAGADPALLARYKGLIEEGSDLPLPEALRLERRIAHEANAALAPAALGAAAAEALRRGRRT
jgi:enoyl-CoA hydratase